MVLPRQPPSELDQPRSMSPVSEHRYHNYAHDSLMATGQSSQRGQQHQFGNSSCLAKNGPNVTMNNQHPAR